MSEITEIKYTINRILFYLENDERTDKRGLVTEVSDLSENLEKVDKKFTEFVNRYEKDQAVKNAKVGLIGAIAGGLVTFAIWLFKIFH